jgi:phosphoribosylformylglycinamidine cyclo-ligase
MDYKSAGVDVEAGYKAVELMKGHVKSTFRPEVLTDIGGFGGLFSIAKAKDMQEPVLVSGTDGVGTKLKLAFLMDKHDTIGIDAVAMCVNDVVCSGAEPLFFLDYIACGKNEPEKIAQIVSGVAQGCRESGCSLIGGETAEMPGFYPVDEYDLAGFTVGIMDKAKSIDGSEIKAGDVLIGIASSGVHSNGYSLVRKVFEPLDKASLDTYYDSLGCTLGEALLTPTKLYVKPVLELISKVKVKGLSHVTGGGFIENIPRMMPEGTKVNINEGTWEILPIFKLLEEKGKVERMSMYNTFNMGIGMVAAVAEEDADKAVEVLESLGEKAYKIGYVSEGSGIEIHR